MMHQIVLRVWNLSYWFWLQITIRTFQTSKSRIIGNVINLIDQSRVRGRGRETGDGFKEVLNSHIIPSSCPISYGIFTRSAARADRDRDVIDKNPLIEYSSVDRSTTPLSLTPFVRPGIPFSKKNQLGVLITTVTIIFQCEYLFF